MLCPLLHRIALPVVSEWYQLASESPGSISVLHPASHSSRRDNCPVFIALPSLSPISVHALSSTTLYRVVGIGARAFGGHSHKYRSGARAAKPPALSCLSPAALYSLDDRVGMVTSRAQLGESAPLASYPKDSQRPRRLNASPSSCSRVGIAPSPPALFSSSP
jgi:hypothetical protein